MEQLDEEMRFEFLCVYVAYVGDLVGRFILKSWEAPLPGNIELEQIEILFDEFESLQFVVEDAFALGLVPSQETVDAMATKAKQLITLAPVAGLDLDKDKEVMACVLEAIEESHCLRGVIH